jgi:hypothetical protein
MILRTQIHPRIRTYAQDGEVNGYLIPIFNINDHFFDPGSEPEQVYITALTPHSKKGPHLHFKRTGFFTCIKGNVRIIVKINSEYVEYYTGENYKYLSIEIPTGIPAVIQNIGDDEALILNMPNPAWTPDMNDEHTADFSDFDFEIHPRSENKE